MKALIQFLQNNTIILMIMFVIALLSGLISIIPWSKRWSKRLYDDVLSKNITLPVYVHLIIPFVVVALAIFLPTTKDRPRGLQTIKGETFGRQRVNIDGYHFVRCKFVGTELVYMGEEDVRLDYNDYEKISLIFGGPANKTILSLSSLYATPEFRPFIEGTFDAIKTGKFRIATPPSDAADD